ncbi:hypothetical protein WG902_20830 [Ramlibacter sp. PS3R-8]|uniref:hypothetical protein n=1 Tax=Ramlibacter sp. PS3R-8 TaxID=3133437 RepID=UPI0030997BF3
MSHPLLRGLVALVLAVPLMAVAAPFAIVVEGRPQDADITTHQITSAGVVLGVSDKGGGYINKLSIPGVGDIIGPVAARYGRGGQVTIRDELHGRKYNPTQAGFTDRAGTHVEVIVRGNEMLLPRRPLSLWHGDRGYDFTQWENLAADPYPKDGGNSDEDGIDESALPGKQADELTSEFDFIGRYSNVSDGARIRIAAFRFEYELRYVRKPGAILQFGRKTRIFDATQAVPDISVEMPAGVHPATETTLSKMLMSSTIRGDRAVWSPSVVFTVDGGGRLVAGRSGRGDVEEMDAAITSLVIFASGSDPKTGTAVGFFQPPNRVNTFNVVGRSAKDDALKYEDRRVTRRQLLGNLSRTGGMWLMGTRVSSTGLLSPLETASGVYEAVRGESYILVGTPQEILDAATKLAN